MARYVNQLPGEGVLCVMIDAFPPDDIGLLDAVFKIGETSIYIAFNARLSKPIIEWIKKMELLGCDIYGKAGHFTVIDQSNGAQLTH